jgi:type IV secretion system protein TrbJ
MKKLITLTFITLGLAVSTRAQWVVYDPANTVQSVINTAQEIVKYVEMINNQVQQIRQLTEQVQTLHHYVDLFGDPSKIAPVSITALTADLKKTELGVTLTELQATADAATAMAYTGAGLFHAVGERFTTPNGATVQRREEPYRPVAAVQQTTDNYLDVSKDAATRRVALKAEIARTTDALRAAQTDAEVQKLTGVLVSLSAALGSTDHEINQATASALVQDIANRADDKRQVEAKKEQQHAEFTEAVDKYGKTFRLFSAPVAFPTR